MQQEIVRLSDYQMSRDLKNAWELISLVSCACDQYDMSHIADRFLVFPEFENNKIKHSFFKKNCIFMSYSFMKGIYADNAICEGLAVALHSMLIDLQKYSERPFSIDTFECKLRFNLKGKGKLLPLQQLLKKAIDSCRDDEVINAVEQFWLFLRRNDEETFDLQKLIVLIRTLDFVEQRDCSLLERQIAKKALQKIELMALEHMEYEDNYFLNERIKELL